MTKDKIAPTQFLTLVFVSRMMVSLTHIPTLNHQEVKTDLLFSIAMSLPVILLFFIPAYLFEKKFGHMTILEVFQAKSKAASYTVSGFYLIWFLFVCMLNMARFVYFATSELSPDIAGIMFVILICIAGAYGAYMGIQSLVRVSSVAMVFMALSFLAIIAMSVQYFKMLNFSPLLDNYFSDNVANAFSVACNATDISTLFFVLPSINGKIRNKFISVLTIITVTVFSLYFTVIGVTGEYAQTQAFPIFALSQITGFGVVERLDAIFTGVWIVSLVLKSGLYLYVANICLEHFLKKKKRPVTIGVCTLIVGVGALVCSGSFMHYIKSSNNIINIITFSVFVIVIPVITLFLKKPKEIGAESA